LVGGDERVRQRLEHDLDLDALLALDALERLHHFAIHRSLRSAACWRARLRALFPLDGFGAGPHSKTVRAWTISGYATCTGSSSTSRSMPAPSAVGSSAWTSTPRRRSPRPSASRDFTDTVDASARR